MQSLSGISFHFRAFVFRYGFSMNYTIGWIPLTSPRWSSSIYPTHPIPTLCFLFATVLQDGYSGFSAEIVQPLPSKIWLYTANDYRQTTDKLILKHVISTLRWIRKLDMVKCAINKQNILIFTLRFVFYPKNVLSKVKSHIKVKITVVCL